jgi:transcriptional regulator with XRE-family HTH domain
MAAILEGMLGKDWDAVARAINERMSRVDVSPTELASRSGVSAETIRELRYNLRPRRRSPRTLAAISEALGWKADQLSEILVGDGSGEAREQSVSAAEFAELRDAVAELTDRVGSIERRLGAE